MEANINNSNSAINNSEQQENALMEAYRAHRKEVNSITVDEFLASIRELENTVDDSRISVAETHSNATMCLDPSLWYKLARVEEDLIHLENAVKTIGELFAPFPSLRGKSEGDHNAAKEKEEIGEENLV